jgi:hypothetical protein
MLIFFVLLSQVNNVHCEVEGLPHRVELITRDAANYLTPENTLAAIHSALIAGMLDWSDEAMTRESREEEIAEFNMAGIDRSRMFELERNIKEEYIVDKITYKDAILLVVEAFGYNGSVQRVPLPFVLEDGLWKFTNKFSSDEVVLEYLRYVPPLFDGKGQSPAEVNSFLGYEQPTQVQNYLEAGTVSYTVHIYYGKSVVLDTFSATLNKEDISTKFSPEPFTDEEVFIPLQQGKNVLLLSVDGKKTDGKIAKDSDRLVFVVP